MFEPKQVTCSDFVNCRESYNLKQVYLTVLYEISNYFLVILIVIFILIYLSIKIKYPFWNLHPVKHSYLSFISWFNCKAPRIVYEYEIPVIKYYNPINVITKQYSKLNDQEIHKVIDFIQCNLLESELLFTTKNREVIEHYVSCDLKESVFSWYIFENNLTGVIFSRPITIVFVSTFTLKQVHEAMFLDTICIASSRNITKPRTKDLYALLESHFINQSHIHTDRSISLFRNRYNSKTCAGICPVVTYKSFVYEVRELLSLQNTPRLPPHFVCESLSPLTWSMFLEQNPFSFCCYPNIIQLIDRDEYFAYCLKRGNAIYAYYFFNKNYTVFEQIGWTNGGKTLEFLGSYNANKTNKELNHLFYLGFKYCLRDILQSFAFSTLIVNNLSHNDGVLFEINKYSKSIAYETMSYFQYNCIWHEAPLDSVKCFII